MPGTSTHLNGKRSPNESQQRSLRKMIIPQILLTQILPLCSQFINLLLNRHGTLQLHNQSTIHNLCTLRRRNRGRKENKRRERDGEEAVPLPRRNPDTLPLLVAEAGDTWGGTMDEGGGTAAVSWEPGYRP